MKKIAVNQQKAQSYASNIDYMTAGITAKPMIPLYLKDNEQAQIFSGEPAVM